MIHRHPAEIPTSVHADTPSFSPTVKLCRGRRISQRVVVWAQMERRKVCVHV